MNLLEMAEFIAGKVRRTDDGSIAKAKEFLRQRYQLVYNRSLWRDALWVLDFTFTPNVSAKPETYDGIKFMPSVVDRVIAIRRTDQPLAGVADEHLFRSGIDEFAQSGHPVKFSIMAPVVAIIPTAFTTALGVSPSVLVKTNAAGDAGRAWKAVIIDTDGDRENLSGTLGAPAESQTVSDTVRVVERFTKIATDGVVDLITIDDEVIVSAAATATAFNPRLPVRLLPTPTAATTFKALVKKQVIPLVNDEDVPELRTVEDAILALAHGDMLERERQYGKAQLKHQEGLALIQDLETRHVFQEDQQQQIIPEVTEVAGVIPEGMPSKGYW